MYVLPEAKVISCIVHCCMPTLTLAHVIKLRGNSLLERGKIFIVGRYMSLPRVQIHCHAKPILRIFAFQCLDNSYSSLCTCMETNRVETFQQFLQKLAGSPVAVEIHLKPGRKIEFHLFHSLSFSPCLLWNFETILTNEY